MNFIDDGDSFVVLSALSCFVVDSLSDENMRRGEEAEPSCCRSYFVQYPAFGSSVDRKTISTEKKERNHREIEETLYKLCYCWHAVAEIFGA